MIDVKLLLIAAALLLPLGLLFACLWPSARERILSLLMLAPIPALVAALFANNGPPLVLGTQRLRFTFNLDTLGAILLGVAALLWIASGAYASRYMQGQPNCARFAICWLMTLAGCIGVFIAADMVSFYFLLALLTLGASGLIVQDGTARAWRACAVYFGLGLLAEAFIVGAFVLLAASTPDNLLIRDAVTALPKALHRDLILALLIAGFGMKAGLVPFHFWMPLAYRAAPIPASAVLSGAVVKASILGLVRFLPLGMELPSWSVGLTTAGLFASFYGVAIGITQTNPKVVLAYSSVSQMGFIVAVIGSALSAGHGDATLPVAFYAAHHVLVKGALFLAVGVITAGGARPMRVMLPAALIALGLGGLPFTGGALAKLAVKDFFSDGSASTLATLSATGTTLLMLHFLHRLASTARRNIAAPIGLLWPWFLMALISVVVPWIVYETVPIGTLEDVIAPAALWETLWPVLLGTVLAVGLRHWGDRLPRVPEGDIAAAMDSVGSIAATCAGTFVRVDVALRQWLAAGVALLVLTVALAVVMVAGPF